MSNSAWNPAYSAARTYKRLIIGEYKSISGKTLDKIRPYLTDEQVSDINRINQERREKCRSDAGQTRSKKITKSIEELLLLNPDKKVRETTKKKHVSQFRGLLNTFKVASLEEILQTYTHDQIRDKITSSYNDPLSYLGLLRLIVMELRHDLDENGVLAEFLKYSKTTAKDEASIRANEKRDRDDSPYDELYENLTNKRPSGTTIEQLLFLLYTKGIYNNNNIISMIPRSYFQSIEIINDSSDYIDKTRNYYILNGGRLIINDHKTSDIYKYDFTLPIELQRFIRESLQIMPRRWLISKKDGSRYTPSALSSLVGRVLGMSVNQYRHVIENALINQGKSPLILARAMAHSITTQLMHYRQRGNKTQGVSV